MDNITVRIYFEQGQKIKGLTFWKKLFYNSFSHYILKAAKEADIKQAISFHVTAGYLAHHSRIRIEHPEALSLKHPQCVELLGEKEKIYFFINKHKSQFHSNQIVIVEDKISFGLQDTKS
jgi:PII-like signaling protein